MRYVLILISTLALALSEVEALDPRTDAAVRTGIVSVVKVVRVQKKDNKRIAPDRGLLNTLLRLEMRRNIPVLRSYTGFYRKYPEDKNFDRASWAAEKKIQEHLAAVKDDAQMTENALTKKISAILLESTEQMAGFMALTLSRTAPEAPPLDADETALLDKTPKSPGA